jgi:hypothetical protein
MKASVIVLILACFASLLSLVTDLLGYTSCISLFGRSGAVLTLCGVVLEYKISSRGQPDTPRKPSSPISMLDLGNATLLTEGEVRAKYFAHTSVILGTFIWGFGDLINGICNS